MTYASYNRLGQSFTPGFEGNNGCAPAVLESVSNHIIDYQEREGNTMKKMSAFMALALFAFSFTVSANANTDPEKEAQLEALNASANVAVAEAKWDVFGDRLVDALQSDHEGLQEAAMRLVIQHGDMVNVKPAVFDVVRIYREHEDENMRRMAVVALSNMDSRWAIRFLQRSEKFEDSPTIQHTIRAVVNMHYAPTTLTPGLQVAAGS